MAYRKIPIVDGEIYHVYNRSIAGFNIFTQYDDFVRMMKTISYYISRNPSCSFSLFEKLGKEVNLQEYPQDHSKRFVDIIAYCIMPTHIHFVLKQLIEGGISRFMNKSLMSYTKYFNAKYQRKGPLWEGRYKNVLVNTNEQLLHLTRYIHLNPTSSGLVDNPKDWKFSSYREYVGLNKCSGLLCDYFRYVDIDSASYEKFCKDHIGYQKDLASIKRLILE